MAVLKSDRGSLRVRCWAAQWCACPGIGRDGRWWQSTPACVARRVPRRGAATQANCAGFHGHDGLSSSVHGAAGCRDDRPAEFGCQMALSV